MLRFLLTIIFVAVSVLLAARALPSVRVRSTGTAFAVALVFGLLNALVGWLLRFLVRIAIFPAGVLTFGLAFLLVPLVVNAVLLWVTDQIIEGFSVRRFRDLVLVASGITAAVWLGQHLG